MNYGRKQGIINEILGQVAEMCKENILICWNARTGSAGWKEGAGNFRL